MKHFNCSASLIPERSNERSVELFLRRRARDWRDNHLIYPRGKKRLKLLAGIAYNGKEFIEVRVNIETLKRA